MRGGFVVLCHSFWGLMAMAQLVGVFTPTGSLTTPRQSHTATLLTNGKVLIAGGGAILNGWPTWASAELYDPAAGTFSPTGSMVTARAQHTATLLPDGKVLIAGGAPSIEVVGFLSSAELYDPSTGNFAVTGLVDGSTIPPQVVIGSRMAEVLFFGGAPGYPGLNQVNVRVPSGVSPGSGVSVRMIYMARPSNEVTIGVQ